MQGRIAEKPGARTKLAALLLGVILLSSAAAFGAAKDFIPRIYSSGGDFDLTVLHQRNENTAAGEEVRSTDLFAAERLRVYMAGFSFHPRFIQFLFTGSGGLSQERSEGTSGSFSENGVGTEYDFRTKILPEHPYNLELYTLRATPLFRGQSSADTQQTTTEKGAIFNYTRRPVFFNMSYGTGANESRVSFSEHETAMVRGSYHTGPFNSSAAYSRTDSSTSSGTHAVADVSSFENTVARSETSLVSKLLQKRSKQDSPFSAALDTATLSWTEQFNAELPWNFSTSAFYSFQKDTFIKETASTEPRKEDASETQSANFTLAHKLYDSVRTAYTVNQSWTETSSGDNKSVTNAVNGTYTKKVPDGRVTIGVRGSQSLVDRENAPLIVGEVYSVPLFGTFTLTNEGVDPTTISVRALTAAGLLSELELNTHYIVEPFGNAAVITIVSLPPEVSAGRPAGQVYTFQITYTLRAGAAKLETTTTGYTVNLSFLKNLLNPYYSRQRSSQTVLSGALPGGGQGTDAALIGIIVQKEPYAITSEYQTTESTVSPSHSLRNIADYTSQLSDTLSLSARIQHSKTVHGEGTLGTGGFTEQVSTVNATINKNMPKKNLNTSFGSSFSRRHATFNTDVYGLTGSLSWNLGTLSVRLSAALNHSETTAAIGKQAALSEYYYLNVSRKLF